MPFKRKWAEVGENQYKLLRAEAEASLKARQADKKRNASKAEGLFKQVQNCINKLLNNPRHPGLNTHKYDSFEHPYNPDESVFEAYAQNQTPGAYRVFWCYGPGKGYITILAITPHP
jgi:hypothetical protein